MIRRRVGGGFVLTPATPKRKPTKLPIPPPEVALFLSPCLSSRRPSAPCLLSTSEFSGFAVLPRRRRPYLKFAEASSISSTSSTAASTRSDDTDYNNPRRSSVTARHKGPFSLLLQHCRIASAVQSSVFDSPLFPKVRVSIGSARYEADVLRSAIAEIKFTCDERPIGVSDADVLWAGTALTEDQHRQCCREGRLVNRFPGMHEFARKRWLSRTLRIFHLLYPQLYDFLPETFYLPENLDMVKQRLSSNNDEFLILKPDAGTQGNGIYLVNSVRDIPESVLTGVEAYVAQKYIRNPMLTADGKKFDIRVYALLVGVAPNLQAFLATEGMVRKCTRRYEGPTSENKQNSFMHFTNFSINKSDKSSFCNSPDIHHPSNSKRLLSDLLDELSSDEINGDEIARDIIQIVQRTIWSMHPFLLLAYGHTFGPVTSDWSANRCFQILGFDILLDDKGKCWLLEVNANPSLRATFDDDIQKLSPIDEWLKQPIIAEGLRISTVVSSPLILQFLESERLRRRGSIEEEQWAEAYYPSPDLFGGFEDGLNEYWNSVDVGLPPLVRWMPIWWEPSYPQFPPPPLKGLLQGDNETAYRMWRQFGPSLNGAKEVANTATTIHVCEKLYERALDYPRVSLLSLRRWDLLCTNSGLKRMISRTVVPCVAQKNSDAEDEPRRRRSLSWPDLKYMYSRPLCQEINPQKHNIEIERWGGISFWTFWELMLQVSAILYMELHDPGLAAYWPDTASILMSTLTTDATGLARYADCLMSEMLRRIEYYKFI